MKKQLTLISLSIFALAQVGWSQCTADYDFGGEAFGFYPDPDQGESFVSGEIGMAYSDVFHFVIPNDASQIDPTLPPITLDSLVFSDANFFDGVSDYTPAEVGFITVCNNNDALVGECSFLGNAQYCISLEGTPTVEGDFLVDMKFIAHAVVFNVPTTYPITLEDIPLTITPESAICNVDENFDSYMAGDFAAMVSSNIQTWSGGTGTAEDVLVSDAQAFSAPNSIYIQQNLPGGGDDNVLAPTGVTSGEHTVSWMMYVIGGNGGYVTGQEDVPGNEFFNCDFLNNGTAKMTVDGVSTGLVDFPQDEWFEVVISIDFAAGLMSFAINGTAFDPIAGVTAFGAVQFYGYTTSGFAKYYIDDLKVCDATIETGCTDSMACNYDPNAAIDDGSCYSTGDSCDDGNAMTINDAYDGDCMCVGEDVMEGCTDTTACNYDSMANTDDGSCAYPGDGCDDGDDMTMDDMYDGDCMCVGTPIIEGCMDTMACNYDSMANVDDGTCGYVGDSCDDGNENTVEDMYDGDCMCVGTEVVLGCLSTDACNFDPLATWDDGSCLFEGDSCDDGDETTENDVITVDCMCAGTPIQGCTDSTACNYNPLAAVDDGSCEYVELFAIEGPDSFDAGTTASYTYDGIESSTFMWTVTNATIVSGQGTSSIEVEFGEDSPVEICVVETTEIPCVGEEVCFSATIGLEEAEDEIFQFFPNPARDVLTITGITPGSQFVIRDMAGRVVATYRLDQNDTVSVDGISEGIYLLEWGVNGAIQETRRLIIR